MSPETLIPPAIEDAPPLTERKLHTILITLYEWGIDDVLIQDGEAIAVKSKGRLIEVGNRPLEMNELEDLVNSVHQSTTMANLMQAVDPDFALAVPKSRGVTYRFRVNITSAMGIHSSPVGIDITMRAIDQIPPSMDKLGVPDDLAQALFIDSGIVIVGGETGSGKTTQLGAIIRSILTDENDPKRIVSYESPIEFDFRAIPNRTGRIAQSDPHEHIKGYPRAGANALRRNPDIILLGEARDAETIDGAIGNAETGHAVYTTAHVNSVAETISRMIGVYPAAERFRAMSALISSTRTLLYQELLPTVDGGRVAAREYLVLNDDIRNELYSVSEGELTQKMKELLWRHGHPLIRDIERHYADGKISRNLYERYQAEYGSGTANHGGEG